MTATACAWIGMSIDYENVWQGQQGDTRRMQVYGIANVIHDMSPYAGPDVGCDARQPTRGPARSALAAAIIGATTNTHSMASYAPPPALPTSATAMPWAQSDFGSGSDRIQRDK